MKINLLKEYTKSEEQLYRREVIKFSDYRKDCIFNPDLKINDVISFWGGYNNDIRYTSKILGFSEDGIYVLWDCYWFQIRDDDIRQIKK